MTNGLKFVLWLVLWQHKALEKKTLEKEAERRQSGNGRLEVVGEEQLPWPWVYLLQSVVSFLVKARKDHLLWKVVNSLVG